MQIDAWGENKNQSNHKADYDFYAITKFPNEEVLKGFEEMLEASGWYNYFTQINVSGKGTSPEAIIGKMIEL